jgi:hypothetical protein
MNIKFIAFFFIIRLINLKLLFDDKLVVKKIIIFSIVKLLSKFFKSSFKKQKENFSSKTDIINMLEGAGFSRSNPYYIVKQGKVCKNPNYLIFQSDFLFRLLKWLSHQMQLDFNYYVK